MAELESSKLIRHIEAAIFSACQISGGWREAAKRGGSTDERDQFLINYFEADSLNSELQRLLQIARTIKTPPTQQETNR